ncbi:MAG: hypothetical protein GXP49_18695 [Deltaproteobacteria bacterium]|nr:hypothetical protein [Deltaproteobacteria bacterium]
MSKPQDGKKGYVRKTYLVDKRFQLKYALLIALGAGIISIGFGAAVYYKTTEATHIASTAMLSWSAPDREGAPGMDMDAEAIEKIQGAMETHDRDVLLAISLFVFALVVVLALWGVLVTHRIAGPIYAISRYLDQITAGKLANIRPLRKKDELKEFFKTFNEMVDALKSRTRDDVEALEAVALELKSIEGNETNIVSAMDRITNLIKTKKSYLNLPVD